MRPSPTSIALIAAALTLPGCGGGDADTAPPAPPANPGGLLDATLAVRSAEVRSAARLELDGAAIPSPIAVELEGPYVAGGAGFPRFDLTGTARVLGFDVDAELVSLGDNMLLSVYGEGYEVGTAEFASVTERLSAIELSTRELLGPVRYEGREEVAGVEADRLGAEIEGEELSAELGPVAELLGLGRLPASAGRLDVWVTPEDPVLRKLAIELAFGIAPEARDRLGGATAGRLRAEALLDRVNEAQALPDRPRGIYQPIADLLRTIGELANAG